EATTIATRHIHDVFGVRARILVRVDVGTLVPTGDDDGEPERRTFDVDDKESGVAEWASQHGRAAGAGTDTLPSASATYLPLEASGKRVGVMGILPSGPSPFANYERRKHLEAFAGQIAAAVDRTRLAHEAHEASLRVEAEQLRNALLSSVSHDL